MLVFGFFDFLEFAGRRYCEKGGREKEKERRKKGERNFFCAESNDANPAVDRADFGAGSSFASKSETKKNQSINISFSSLPLLTHQREVVGQVALHL